MTRVMFCFQKWKKMKDLFSSILEAFNVMYNILSNLDKKDTFFLYREQNHPMLEGYNHPFFEGYCLAQYSSKIGLYWSSIFGRLFFSIMFFQNWMVLVIHFWKVTLNVIHILITSQKWITSKIQFGCVLHSKTFQNG